MKLKMKALGLCAVMLCTAVSGCGTKPANTSGQEQVTVSISFWEPGTENEFERAYTDLVAQYEALHPEVNIEIMSQPYSGYQEWLKTQMAADTMPTIIYNDGTPINELYRAGMIEPLDEYLEGVNEYADNQIWKDLFADGKLEKIDNAYQAIPISGLGLAYYYNKDLYQELGLSVPKTWDEFLENCKAIQAKDINPIAFMAQKEDAVNWLQWLICTGMYGDAFLEDQNINVNNDNRISEQELVRAIDIGYLDVSKPGKWQDFYLEQLDVIAEYSKYAENASGLDEAGAKAQFLGGKAGHIYSGSWDVQAFLVNSEAPFEIGAFQFPYFTKENSEYAGLGMSIPQVSVLAVSKQKDQRVKDAAVDFLKFITAPDNYKKYVEYTRCIPSIDNLEIDDSYKAFIGGERQPNLFFALKGSKSGYTSYDAAIDTLNGLDVKNQETLDKIQKSNMEYAKERMETLGMSPENNYLDIQNDDQYGGEYRPSDVIMAEKGIVID